MKTLLLLRHAKSAWSDASLGDRDRPLNPRGKRARKVIAEHLAGTQVDLVVCSTAARARATAKPVVAALECPVRYDDAVYGATADGLLDVVRALADEVGTALLVGHNPSVEDLTTLLCGWSPAYPTAALGTVDLDVERWVDAEPGCGTLRAHVTAAELQRAT